MGVKLEVFRMLLYLSFPVGVFWVSNQAQYFQQFVVQRRREIFPPDNPERRREVAALKQRVLRIQEERALRDTRG